MSQHHTGGSRWIVLSRLSNISVHAASGVTACACCHPGGDGGGGGGGGEYEVEDASSVATATSAGWREGRTIAPVAPRAHVTAVKSGREVERSARRSLA